MKNSSLKFDVLVVGGGAAGCVVAGHLAEKTNASIAVIEAGKDDTDMLIKMPAGYSRLLAKDRHLWQDFTVPQYGTPRRFRSGKVLGGGSSVNAMCYVRGQREDYDLWAEATSGEGGWSGESMWQTFIEQERNEYFSNEHHGTKGTLNVQLPRGINELNQRCLKAFQEYGLPYNHDYNGASQIGVSPVQSNVLDKKRCSAVVAHLRRHIDSGRVKLFTETTVTRVLMDGARAVGVEVVNGAGISEILANHVVLSAGAVHTPHLLMHSGIGPEEQLQKFGIKVKVDSPDVGENLHDHPIIPVNAYAKGRLGYQNVAQGLGTIKAGLQYFLWKEGPASGNGCETVTHWNPLDLAGKPTVQSYHVPIISNDGLSPTGTRSGITFELVVLQPKSRGWIRLADGNPMTRPLINPNFLGHQYDLDVTVASVHAIRKVMKQPSLAEVLEEEVNPGQKIQTDKEIAEWAKTVATTMWHPVGTCRMGSDDRAVVDGRLRVKGAQNLRVIDASIMPTIISGNTNAPTQALALRAAKMMVEELFS
ncbi:GMC family oxidoreductase N-terminal domain-containing protein (plasmid) [Pseudomonas sp. BYT-5]|uniref:GMC family oxidoreductase n=1 Tax=Pseudomonas sp. BYT-5 TaxID=2944392 RepID=UPI002021F39A|nr:GMC family oxidoreductase N-terminal domain-containing protein [Pseudomonas sp. BYT-5]URD45391.1 GMC family oxidoreductase N-terminal domain-containing protein [Pseudomonas sp. BYT-5]